MKKIKLLPAMALKGIISNGNVYFPYLAAGIFSVFTYFVFASILQNDLMKTLPRSAYAWSLLMIGKGLLAVILLFFLIYANSFLVKRRQREFGIYNILGLEKKHIASMLFFEVVLIYTVVLAGGIILGLVLAKLLFLVLLRMCSLPIETEFVFLPEAFRETLIFFFWVYAANFCNNLWQMGKAKPVDLMSGSKKGEKEPKLLWVWALFGIAALGGGYYCSITSKIDSTIFTDFFLAVFLVIIGTYLLFTSGSIAFLKLVKRKKRFYYRPKNFITISGMLYRMKKSAASLSNICIFSTMVIITLVCTVSLYLGMDGIVHFVTPYDVTVEYQEEKAAKEEVWQEIGLLEEKYGIAAQRVDIYEKMNLSTRKDGNSFVKADNQFFAADSYSFYILTWEEYAGIESGGVNGSAVSRDLDGISENEVLIYCSGQDFGYHEVNFFGEKLMVKEELPDFFPEPKAYGNLLGSRYLMVVRDKQVKDSLIKAWCNANGVADVEEFINSETQYVRVVLEGEDKEKADFIRDFAAWGQSRPGFSKLTNGVENRSDSVSMYGGLLFIGILFGLIFFMCLILIMYYKQITEGYEDRNSFDIMQKVGMSDKEIRGTVHRQILMVFGMPLVGALLHTMAGMFMVKGLMAAISLFNIELIIRCTAGVAILFVAIYGVSYLVTAKTYYKIVRQGE